MVRALGRREGGVPQNLDEVAEFVDGPLREELAANADPDVVDEVVERISGIFEKHRAGGAAYEIDVDLEIEEMSTGEGTDTATMPVAERDPVRVLVASSGDEIADRLLASLGRRRVAPTVVADEPALRKQVFAMEPLLVLVDCDAPPRSDATEIARALAGLPRNTLPIVWAVDAPYGRVLAVALASRSVEAVRIPKRDGIEPLLDLVASRHQP
jgi:hypothetical protein